MYQDIIMTIREELAERNLSIPDLAEMTGYTANGIGNWLRFVNVAKFTAIEDILDALGYTLICVKKEDVNV